MSLNKKITKNDSNDRIGETAVNLEALQKQQTSKNDNFSALANRRKSLAIALEQPNVPKINFQNAKEIDLSTDDENQQLLMKI